jgi:hypothetical protein
MILAVHVQCAPSYDIGDEIWQASLADAIRAEAEIIAGYAGLERLGSTGEANRDALRERIVLDMTRALVRAGDRFRAPDGVLYSLADHPALDPHHGKGRLDPWPPQNQTHRRGGPPVREPPTRIARHTPRRSPLERRHGERSAQVALR